MGRRIPGRLTLALARSIVDAMIRFAQDNMLAPGSYAVADEGGYPLAFERRDGAPPATSDIALEKAWTAATMKASGRLLEVITRGQGWRLNVKYGGRLTVIPGTIPIIAGGKVIGGIGHSGESAENDLRIAQAGLAALYREDPPKPERLDPTLSLARRVAEQLIEAGKPVAVAVVDEWGWPIVMYRADNAAPGLVEIARSKAWTAAAFRTPSEEASKYCRSSAGEARECECTRGLNERYLPLPGGIPFTTAEDTTLAVGVAGLTPEEDKALALKALSSLGLKPLT